MHSLTVVMFLVLSIGAFWIDLKAHKDDHEISLKDAALWSIFWVGIACLFGGYLYVAEGSEMASLFFTGYALEKVLSVDNLFVIMAIFSWFQVPNQYRHRVLYWGIIGAIVFRLIFVAIGTSLLSLGPRVEILFAMIIMVTAIMMLKNIIAGDEEEEEVDYGNHLAVRLLKKFYPVGNTIENHDFLVREGTKWIATPLLACLMVIELSDVMFAFDSVPAVIAVSREPIIVFSAMMFAILGLRTMYFVLEALKKYLVHLEKAVVALLFFIGFKLTFNSVAHFAGVHAKIDSTTSLMVVISVLSIGVLASLFEAKRK
ncbi:MAG: TerC/Alx family metal homeostasis membrane protein [Fusobacteriaceae bacterium]